MTTPPPSEAGRDETSGAPADPGDRPGRTGQPDVDAALERLRDVEALPVAEHVEVYDEVHQRLASAMDDTQDRQPPTGSG